MKHYVYYILDPSTRDLLYVGRSTDPHRRLVDFQRKHKRPAMLGFVLRFQTLDEAQAAELSAIKRHRPQLNRHWVSSPGALGHRNALGYRHTAEAIERIRASATGRRQSPETCRLKSEIQKGDKAYWFGKKMSPETRAKMSEGMRRAWIKRRARCDSQSS